MRPHILPAIAIFICCLSLLSAPTGAKDRYQPTNLDGKYKPLTRQNLSKIYWRTNKMDINNDADIDNFIMLNRCDLYQQYFHNDFRWHEIRKNARVSIAKHRKKFPRHLRIVRQIYLERYNPDTESFKLQTPIETSNFQIRATDVKTWPCREDSPHSIDIWRYPHKAILSLSTPLKIEYFKVPSLVAFQYNALFNNEESKKTKYRPAYLVQDIKVFEADPFYNEFGKNETGTLSAVLDNLHVYGDKNLNMLLYTEKMR